MKKIFLILVLSTAFMSCEKSENLPAPYVPVEYNIEGKWTYEANNLNTLYIFEDGTRYTYYCGTAECDEVYWNSLEISDAIPGTENYTFEDGVLTVDLNFGNELVTPLTFECDGNQVNFVTPGYSLYRIGSDCD